MKRCKEGQLTWSATPYSLPRVSVFRFWLTTLPRRLRTLPIACKASWVYMTSIETGAAVAQTYDAEYAGALRPHYTFLNALLCPGGLAEISGIPDDRWANLSVLDVGAGSNELLRHIARTTNVNRARISGTDLSLASVDLLRRDGFIGLRGRLETLQLSASYYDIVFLSYFLDYDPDQRSTFQEAVRLVSHGGTLVLEANLPASQFGVLPRDRQESTTVTRGRSLDDDLRLIIDELRSICAHQLRIVQILTVVKSSRYVYSRYGFCLLPSIFVRISLS